MSLGSTRSPSRQPRNKDLETLFDKLPHELVIEIAKNLDDMSCLSVALAFSPLFPKARIFQEVALENDGYRSIMGKIVAKDVEGQEGSSTLLQCSADIQSALGKFDNVVRLATKDNIISVGTYLETTQEAGRLHLPRFDALIFFSPEVICRLEIAGHPTCIFGSKLFYRLGTFTRLETIHLSDVLSCQCFWPFNDDDHYGPEVVCPSISASKVIVTGVCRVPYYLEHVIKLCIALKSRFDWGYRYGTESTWASSFQRLTSLLAKHQGNNLEELTITDYGKTEQNVKVTLHDLEQLRALRRCVLVGEKYYEYGFDPRQPQPTIYPLWIPKHPPEILINGFNASSWLALSELDTAGKKQKRHKR